MLVKLEDVQKILLKPTGAFKDQESFYKVYNEINSLPSHDPIAVLKEMIDIEQDKLNDLNPLWKVKQIKERKLVLEKAISRITNHNNQG